MFKMIGGDGLEYGPVPAEQIREWIAEHRANGGTLVKAEGSTDWTPLARVPEFAEALTAAANAPAEQEPSQRPPALLNADAYLGLGDEKLPVTECLARGWALMIRHIGLTVGGATLLWVILTVASFGQCFGVVLNLVISGPLYGGLAVLYLNMIRERDASLRDLFSGFGPLFVPLMLVWLVSWVLGELGLAFCLIPGLFLKVIWAFGLFLVADRQMAFWAALELSRKVVMRRFFSVAGLMILAHLPLVVFETYSLYRVWTFMVGHFGPPSAWQTADLKNNMEDLFRFAAEIGLQEQFVLLLNLPFATAAMLHAYALLFRDNPAERR